MLKKSIAAKVLLPVSLIIVVLATVAGWLASWRTSAIVIGEAKEELKKTTISVVKELRTYDKRMKDIEELLLDAHKKKNKSGGGGSL